MMRALWRWLITAAFAAGLAAQAPDGRPGTALLDWTGELDVRMMDGAHRFAERKIAESIGTSPAAHERSIAANRARFLEKIGAVDRLAVPGMERFGDDSHPALVADAGGYRVYQVRWPVLEGVHGEGLLLEPRAKPAAYVIALPGADQTPEQLARVLAESECLVLVPTPISRGTRWSGRPGIRMTDQPHREWIYRQAFHMGRHVIGHEVQKVRAAAGWIRQRDPNAKIGVAGYAEGALIALYAAAADPGIDAALVSGYFDSRQKVWAEPIYRNVWGLLEEFGDAEIASLIAPRALIVEFSKPPEIKSSKGDLTAPAYERARAEFARIDEHAAGFSAEGPCRRSGAAYVGAGSRDGLARFLSALGARLNPPAPARSLADSRRAFDPEQRLRRQVKELEGHAQMLVRAPDFGTQRATGRAAPRGRAVLSQLAASHLGTSAPILSP